MIRAVSFLWMKSFRNCGGVSPWIQWTRRKLKSIWSDRVFLPCRTPDQRKWPQFREGKSLPHRKSDGLRLTMSTWLGCWRTTLILLLASSKQFGPRAKSFKVQDLPCWRWHLQTDHLPVLLPRTEERSSSVYRTRANYQTRSLFSLMGYWEMWCPLWTSCHFLGERRSAWRAGIFAIYRYFSVAPGSIFPSFITLEQVCW